MVGTSKRGACHLQREFQLHFLYKCLPLPSRQNFQLGYIIDSVLPPSTYTQTCAPHFLTLVLLELLGNRIKGKSFPKLMITITRVSMCNSWTLTLVLLSAKNILNFDMTMNYWAICKHFLFLQDRKIMKQCCQENFSPHRKSCHKTIVAL